MNNNINKLIDIGQSGQKSKEEFSRDFLYSLPHVSRNLSFDPLVNLIRGVAILEMDQSKYGFGSTTVVGHLLKTLKLRKSGGQEQDITDLINWLLAHRANPYVPFGSFVALEIKSIQGYEKYLAKQIQHQKEMDNLNKLRSIEAKKGKQINVLQHKSIADKKNEERTATIKKLKKLTVNSRLKYILESDKPINYFPGEFAEITASDFEKLPKDLMNKLYSKLEQAKKGTEWNSLKKVIYSHLAHI